MVRKTHSKFGLEIFFLFFLNKESLGPSLFARLCHVWEKNVDDDDPRAKSRNRVIKEERISDLAVSYSLAQIIQL